jgi:methylthioribose-1-phosphate isomerase
MIETVVWNNGAVRMIDQTRLPAEEIFVDLTDPAEIAQWIKALKVRGAPAIGVAAAMGIAAAAWEARGSSMEAMKESLKAADEVLRSSRPTASNLFWALDRMNQAWCTAKDVADPLAIAENLVEEAQAILKEDLLISERLGQYGGALFKERGPAMTHCNAGGLATGGGGTALAVLRHAHAAGFVEKVFVDETRPLLQGARLTAWELKRDGIPACLICDSSSAWVMKNHGVKAVVVGTDRVAANGDVANKIGTYSVAIAAKRHGVPFYVAAPTSTLDPALRSGDLIPIEERSPDEITGFGGARWAPEGMEAFNPAFDVTPAELVTAIVTDVGVLRAPYEGKIESAVAQASSGLGVDRSRATK